MTQSTSRVPINENESKIVPDISEYRGYPDFMSKHMIKNKDIKNIITNTRIGDSKLAISGGSYNISDAEYTFKRYFKLVANKNMVQENLSLNLVELGIKKNQLPSSNAANNLLKKITVLGEKRGVEITSFKISKGDMEDFYKEINIQLKLSGGLWGTMDMLASIENMLQIVDLEKISFNLGNHNDELVVSSSFVATIYVYLESF